MNEDFQYDRIKDGVKIFKYTGAAENVTIPATIDNLPVTEIGNKAFFGCGALKTIDIPDSVKIIAEDAFEDCENLVLNISFSAEFKLGNIFIKPKFIPTVKPTDAKKFEYTIIGNRVRIDKYKYKDKDTAVAIPALIKNLPVTEIGDWAFSSCENLTEIYIPDSVTRIGEHCFSFCRKLIKVNIPDGVKEIEEDTFLGCDSLTEICIPDSVTYIAYLAFADCTSLRLINLPQYVKIDNVAFYNCPAKIICRDKK